jgi:2-aminoadipate transaminase
MPTFHNPTGTTLGEGQRRALMSVVTETDVPVLEDEVEGELRIEGRELPSLATMDPRGLTVTVRSFSKGLFPGVRLGWVEATPDVLGPMAALKRFSDLESSPFLQEALHDFIEHGAMDRYLGGLRAELRARHRAATAALVDHMPAGTRFTRPEGGLSLWVELPEGLDSDRVAVRAAGHGVLVTPGRVFDPAGGPSRSIRLALSCVAADRVVPGIEILARCVREENDVRPLSPSRSPLIL